MSKSRYLMTVWFATILAGCNKGSSVVTYPVTGTVNYDGKPLEGATVAYMCEDASGPCATAVTDSNGRFSLSTYVGPTQILRGAVPGDYQVTIVKQTREAQATTTESVDIGTLSPNERQRLMSKMWQEQNKASSADHRGPPVQKPKSEIPTKYALPESSGLTATVKAGENEPREFKLID